MPLGRADLLFDQIQVVEQPFAGRRQAEQQLQAANARLANLKTGKRPPEVETVAEQLRQFRSGKRPSEVMAVIADFPDLVERMCGALGVPTDRLVLELTEGATQPLIKLMDTLTRFRIKGIGLAIDDFGVGYSSLMQLRQLPFTELKIDRFFIADATTSKDSALIVKCIIDLAHGLGLSCTAEGVETEEQLALLCAMKCDVAQGYLIAHPLEPKKLKPWLAEWATRWPAYARAATAAEPAVA